MQDEEQKCFQDIEEIVQLRQIFRYSALIDYLDSDNFAIMQKAAYAIHELGYDAALPRLIEKASDKSTLNHKSALLYSCSAFDCSEYVDTLVDIIFQYGFHAALESYSLIRRNCNFSSLEEIDSQIKIIEERREGSKNIKNDGIIESLIEFLVKLPFGNSKLEPFSKVGIFRFDSNIEEYLKNNMYNVVYGEELTTLDSYYFEKAELTIFVDHATRKIDSILCEDQCIYNDVDLIGMNVQEFFVFSDTSNKIEPEIINEDSDCPKLIYDFETLGLEVWVEDDIITSIIASGREE